MAESEYIKKLPSRLGYKGHSSSVWSKTYSDDSTSCQGISREHQTVKHSTGEYIKGPVSMNIVESFWPLLKCGYRRTFYHLSEEYLNRYVREFMKQNNIRDFDMAEQMAVLIFEVVEKGTTTKI